MFPPDELEADLDFDLPSIQLKAKIEILNNSLESLGLRQISVDSSYQPNEKDVHDRIEQVKKLIKDAEEESMKSMAVEHELSHKIEQINEQVVCFFK